MTLQRYQKSKIGQLNLEGERGVLKMPHGLKRPDTANPEENTDRFHHMFMVGRRLTINQ